MFEENVHLEDVLLNLALGHGLAGSKSVLTMLPKDIVQRFLAKEVEKCYWNSRRSSGLLTPTNTSSLRCDQICGKHPLVPFYDLKFRRVPILSVVSCPVQAKENLVLPLAKSSAVNDLTAPTMSRFIANRYKDLFKDGYEQNVVSTNDALACCPSNSSPLMESKLFRRRNVIP
jgi:hypothetical protein